MLHCGSSPTRSTFFFRVQNEYFPYFGSILEFRFRYKIYCCIECKKEYFINLKNDIELYKLCSKFKFNLSDYEDNFDFDLIKKFGWYKAKNHGNNINGVSRDHMFSINEGFKQLINPLLIAHPANCKLIKNTNNQKKTNEMFYYIK